MLITGRLVKALSYKMYKTMLDFEKDIEVFLAQAHRLGASNLMLCSSGNLSWRKGNYAYLTGAGSWLGSMTADKVSILQIETGELDNHVKPSVESGFHLGVLRERSDVNVVLHFQSEYATAVACLKNKPDSFNVTVEIPAYVGRNIPIVPYLRPGSFELADAVTKAMLKHNVVMLANHGQVVCGKTFDEVFERATFFEMACRIIIQTQGNYSVLSEKEIDDLEFYLMNK